MKSVKMYLYQIKNYKIKIAFRYDIASEEPSSKRNFDSFIKECRETFKFSIRIIS